MTITEAFTWDGTATIFTAGKFRGEVYQNIYLEWIARVGDNSFEEFPSRYAAEKHVREEIQKLLGTLEEEGVARAVAAFPLETFPGASGDALRIAYKRGWDERGATL